MSIIYNLISALIAFLIAYAFSKIKRCISDRDMKWFWQPNNEENIFIYTGQLKGVFGEVGEIEPAINIYDAQALGQIKLILAKYYKEIVTIFDDSKLDYQFPIISLGGPVPNNLTKTIGESGKLPLWFVGMPYSKTSERAIGNKNESYKSDFDDNRIFKSDVGFIARIQPEENQNSFLYIIAGNYGFGTLGVISYFISSRNIRRLRKEAKKHKYFQAIIKSTITNNNISSTELLRFIGLG